MTCKTTADALHAELTSDPIIPTPRPNGRAVSVRDHRNDKPVARPKGLSAADILALEVPDRKWLIEDILPQSGAYTIIGSHKSGKTVLGVQMAISAASGHALFDNYRVMDKGPAIVVEQDDPDGGTSIAEYLRASPVPAHDLPLTLFTAIRYSLGSDFNSWLESEIERRQARLVILDSYTSLRPHRTPGGDIVKIESSELTLLNALAKRHRCAIALLHHVSGGRSSMEWSDQASGTFAQGAAVDGQIHMSRFQALPGVANERLLQGRLRHGGDFSAVIRFRKATLDYEVVLEGPGAPLFVEIMELQQAFADRTFGQKELYQELGMSRTSAFRLSSRLAAAGVLLRHGYGEYRLSTEILRQLGTGRK